jgi:hypothetical protein
VVTDAQRCNVRNRIGKSFYRNQYLYTFSKCYSGLAFGSKLLESYETGERQKKFIAILTALLFAIHPMRVESVIWCRSAKTFYMYFFYCWVACSISNMWIKVKK